MNKKLALMSATLLALLLFISTTVYQQSPTNQQVLGINVPTSLPATTPILLEPAISSTASVSQTTNNHHQTTVANGEIAQVAKVIDGDTIQLSDGRKLRYIGIDTPETVDPRRSVECYGQQASEKNRELVLGKEIIMEKDISDTDKFGRLLRYVYVGEVMINQLLISEGFARAKSYPPDIKYQQQFQQAERLARENQRGLWGEVCTNSNTTPGAGASKPHQQKSSSTALPTQHSLSACPKNCREARSMGMTNINSHHHCYQPKMDGDHDDIACEQ